MLREFYIGTSIIYWTERLLFSNMILIDCWLGLLASGDDCDWRLICSQFCPITRSSASLLFTQITEFINVKIYQCCAYRTHFNFA